MAFAIDHRSQFEAMAKQYGLSVDAIRRAKSLAYQAFHKVAKGAADYGMLLDSEFGRDPLAAISDHDYWVGRPIEFPGKRPLEFESSADVATELMEWPANHTVKCLVPYHPNDPVLLRQQQDEKILQLYDACRKRDMSFYSNLFASPYGDIDDDTVATALDYFYRLGVYPDWWKLEPSRLDRKLGQNLPGDSKIRSILSRHRSSRIVKPLPELAQSLGTAAKFPMIKGFAVGRSIFETPLRTHFAGEIGEDEAVTQMAKNFEMLTQAWLTARSGELTRKVEFVS